jgi:hypothetical protein
MKTLPISLFIILFFYCISPAKAQYQSLFGQNSTEWVFEWSNMPGSAQDTFYLVQDTILNGFTYKLVQAKMQASIYNAGLFREDTILGKVWHRPLAPYYFSFPDTVEQLLFDYSLSVGDSFLFRNVWMPNDTIIIVDTVYYDVFNRKNIKFSLFVGHEPLTFIEGVGSNYGIMYQNHEYVLLWGQYLLCYHRDGVQTYLNNFYNTCLVHDGSPTIKTEAPNIQLFPNPIQDFLYIENPTAIDITQIKVYNNLGQKVMELPFSATLDFSQLSKGIYSIQLLNKQGIIFTKPFVKL